MNLSEDEMRVCFDEIMSGKATACADRRVHDSASDEGRDGR